MSTDLVALKERSQTIRGILESRRAELSKLATKHMNPERMLRVALTTIGKSDKLLMCTPTSILACFMEAARLGLEIDQKRACLVPFNRECTLIIGYQGLSELVHRSGAVQGWPEARVVYSGDDFEYALGLEPRLVHVPRGMTEEVTHVYALIRPVGAPPQFEVMTRREIDAIMRRSPAIRGGYDSPWRTDYAEMARKTALRRLLKYSPVSQDVTQAIEITETAEAGGNVFADIMVDADASPLPEAPKMPPPAITHDTSEVIPEEAPAAQPEPPAVDLDGKLTKETKRAIDHELVYASDVERRNTLLASYGIDSVAIQKGVLRLPEGRGRQLLADIKAMNGSPE